MDNSGLARVKMQNELGIMSEYPTPAQIKKRFPFLELEGVVSGSFYKEDGLADPAALLEHYEVEASLSRIPALEKSNVKKVISSMSDETPDKHAVIDEPYPNFIVCTGFSGHGFMHAPAAGKIVAQMVQGEQPCTDISCLKIGRKQVKECVAI